MLLSGRNKLHRITWTCGITAKWWGFEVVGKKNFGSLEAVNGGSALTDDRRGRVGPLSEGTPGPSFHLVPKFARSPPDSESKF